MILNALAIAQHMILLLGGALIVATMTSEQIKEWLDASEGAADFLFMILLLLIMWGALASYPFAHMAVSVMD